MTVLRMLPCLLALSLALTGAAPADDLMRIASGQKGNWENIVPELGQQQGFFKKHGLTLDITYTQGSAETMQVVLSGSADVGLGVGTANALGAFARGAPVRAIANHTTGAPGAFWYVPANSPIKSMKEADGKTIGFSTTGSSSYTALQHLAKLSGITPKLVATGNPASTFTQTMSGQIDVGWSSPPFGLEAAADGRIRIIGRGSDVPALRNQTVRVQLTNVATYEKRKDVLDRYLAAYTETLNWMYADPEAIKIYSRIVKIPEAVTQRMRDEFYPKQELAIDRLEGVDDAMQEAIQFKYMTAPLAKSQLKQLFVYSKAFD